MEKRGFGLLLFVVAGITSVALCGSSVAATTLQLKLAKGKTYYQRTVVDQHITQTVMNQPQVIDITVGMGMKLDVLDVDGAGQYADSVHLHLVHVETDRRDGDPEL